MYLGKSSSISLQESFLNPGYSSALRTVDPDEHMEMPDIKPYIPALMRRRMGPLLRMAVAAAVVAAGEDPSGLEGVIVGTALGMGNNTADFIDELADNQGQLISPTNFTVSTANTIAGQISLILGLKGYNITHTQGALSMEYALLDAQMQVDEGMKKGLVGCADQWFTRFFNIERRLGISKGINGEGSAFFQFKKKPTSKDDLSINKLAIFHAIEDPLTVIKEAVAKYRHLSADIILFASTESKLEEELQSLFPASTVLDYIKYLGHSMSASGLALEMACDMLRSSNSTKSALIVNNLVREELGLIQISRA